MCCKILAIEDLNKPPQKWCPNCVIGTGCGIYETRPTECRDFFCSWLVDAGIPDHWQPSKSRMILTYASGENQITVHVDADRPHAWRKEPYYSQIRQWAAAVFSNNGKLLVRQGADVILVLPDGEHNLGPMKDGQAVVTVDPGAQRQ